MKVALLYPAEGAHLRALQAAAPGATLYRGDASLEAACAALAGADAVLGNHHLCEALAQVDQRALRWVQVPSVGVERQLAALREPGTLLSSARGLYDEELADHALALALGVLRGLGPARDRQRSGAWERVPLGTLSDRPALVLGLGGLGAAIARRLQACGARVLGLRRRAELGAPPGVELVADLHAALPACGLLLLALPLTARTRGLVGAPELAALPEGAVLVNVARGELVDEPGLLAALRGGRLRGAGLDVFAEEPLPAGHALWQEPRALITPHQGRAPGRRLWEARFVDNLRRFARGEPPLHLVSREHGY